MMRWLTVLPSIHLSIFFCAISFFPKNAFPLELNSVNRGSLNPMMRSLNNAPWGYQNHVVAQSEVIEQFIVRNGDCFANRSWNDCEKDRQRSELSEKHKVTRSSDHVWYHWEFYLGTNFPDLYPTKVTLVQFHQVKAKPSWMFELDHQGYWLVDHLHLKDKRRYLLLPWEQLRGQWHQFDVNMHWSNSKDGRLQLWVDGESVADYHGVTMQAELSYFKYGIYQAFISRYKKANASRMLPTQRIYYRHVWAGDRRWQGNAKGEDDRPPQSYFKP